MSNEEYKSPVSEKKDVIRQPKTITKQIGNNTIVVRQLEPTKVVSNDQKPKVDFRRRGDEDDTPSKSPVLLEKKDMSPIPVGSLKMKTLKGNKETDSQDLNLSSGDEQEMHGDPKKHGKS
jgi:hypothetical protein